LKTFSEILPAAIIILVIAFFGILTLWFFLKIFGKILKGAIKGLRYSPQAVVFVFWVVKNIPHATVATLLFIRKYPSVLVLIATNLAPLLGVFYFEWNVFMILALYWLESAVVGFYTILKLPKAAAPSTPEELKELGGYRIGYNSPVGLTGKKLVGFFSMHYGVFMGIHAGLLQILMFATTGSPNFYVPLDLTPTALFSLLGSTTALFISHGISYRMNFIGKQEFLSISPAAQVMQPYRRIVVMHMTVVFGAWFAIPFRSATGFIVVLIASKILLDVLFHLKEHNALPQWLKQGNGARIMVTSSF